MRSRSQRGSVATALRLALSLLGLGAAAWAALTVQHQDVALLVAFAAAYALVDAMSVRLTRGDYVLIDAAVSISAAVALSPSGAVLASLVGTATGVVSHRRTGRTAAASLTEVFRKPLLMGALALVSQRVLDASDLFAGLPLALLLCGLLGILYSLADFALLVLLLSLDTHTSMARVASGLGRPLVALYAAHVSLGVATALLLGQVGAWSLWAMVALVLLSQYSFNLLLQTRRAYSETIQALMRASELRVDEALRGHSQRVADIAVAAGRMFGLSGRTLEQLNYAALLHEIGRIGLGDDCNLGVMLDEHAQRGASIVAGIPFLDATTDMIANQRTPYVAPSVDNATRTCASIIGACCDLDRSVAATDGRWMKFSAAEDILPLIVPLPDQELRRCIADAAAQVAGSRI